MQIKIISSNYLDKLEESTNIALEELKEFEIVDLKVSMLEYDIQNEFMAVITYR
ncbi:hypothetical protein H7992_21765 [Sporosarcina sp. resist]|uniref:hypothetical protein n=1 Tax=Sporosarcina sp. resist TaxID=2762563 RepID=UPI00164D0EAA|nr:hypothetical protein [Sporosarcina sp. resist]QNK87762.1 hypothetical protein H7992_21765 [Sporosarcina sp. resist]